MPSPEFVMRCFTPGAEAFRVLLTYESKNMTKGTVKFFNATRGFGFISPEDGSKDVFVHISALEQSGLTHIDEGQVLSFDVEADARGPKAVNLQAE